MNDRGGCADIKPDVHMVPVDDGLPTRRLGAIAHKSAIYMRRWCPGEDSNFHGLMATGT